MGRSTLGHRRISIWYEGCGCSWTTMARPMAMTTGNDAVDALGALVLRRFQIAGGVLGDGDVGGHPAITGSSVEDAPKLGATLD
jgi:hypothetical protein